jgi:hypothetical protein
MVLPGRYFVLIAFIYFLSTGCSGNSKNNMMPKLAYCDSAAVMFYNTPGNPRFFKMTKVHEKSVLSAIGKDVNGKVVSGKESCTTQGKIYYYGQKDEVFVVYFNKDDTCMLLSFIKTGEKYFTKMDKATKQILDDLQQNAKEPGVKN